MIRPFEKQYTPKLYVGIQPTTGIYGAKAEAVIPNCRSNCACEVFIGIEKLAQSEH